MLTCWCYLEHHFLPSAFNLSFGSRTHELITCAVGVTVDITRLLVSTVSTHIKANYHFYEISIFKPSIKKGLGLGPVW